MLSFTTIRPPRAFRSIAFALAGGAALLAGCTGESEDMTAVTTTRTPTVAASKATTAGTAASTSTAAASPAAARLRVRDAWARSTAGNPDENSAVYLVVENPGGADRLVAATISPPISKTVELHVTEMSNGQMVMRPVPAWDVPGNGGMLELKPAGNHVMLVGLNRQLKVGDTISLTLRFEQAGEVKVDAPVRDAATAVGGAMTK